MTIMKALEILAAATTALGIPVLAAAVDTRQPHQPLGGGSRILSWNDTMASSRFRTRSFSVSWVGGSGANDGEYVAFGDGGLLLQDIVSGNKTVFIPDDQIPDRMRDYWISPDRTRVLFSTNATSRYRHSYAADYVVLDRTTGATRPLVADQAGDIQYAEFAPAGNALAFVRGNNIFLVKNGNELSQLTFDGSSLRFNGVPDWVYEEEIFSDRKALWFSPDGKRLAFLSFDEAGVQTFPVTYFMSDQRAAPSYPRQLLLSYPKVGSTNPRAYLAVVDVESESFSYVPVEAFQNTDLIIGEVVWLTGNHSSLIYRAFNRVQDQEKLVLVDAETGASKVVRERNGSDGWLDNNLAIQYIGSIGNSSEAEWYLDQSDESGWNHIYLYSVDGTQKIPLTSGEWEVVSVNKIDKARKLVYFTSTKHHSTERHLYSVSYETRELKALVDDTVSAVWSASFSMGGGYYIRSYRGPNVPYQELYSVNSSTPLRVLENNEAFMTSIQDYKLPNISYFELQHPDGFTLNVMQRLPANFDPTKRYPMIFLPYGGPGSQSVSKSFQSIGWESYLASDPELEYISYVVDGRGTGYKGRKYRAAITGQMGKLETADQIWAARELIARYTFIDAGKVAMWGWSFGGYLTAKVVEADSGVFTLGLVTAPVSDWRLYDSMYTERYMKTLEGNAAGYNETAVRRPDGFRNIAGGTVVFHGTGDDNVHYQNSAALVDLLVGAGVPPAKLRWYAFTDSTHSINYNGASPWLYRELTTALYEEKVRTAEVGHQWSRRRIEEASERFRFQRWGV